MSCFRLLGMRILSLVVSACPLTAAEFQPVAVWTDAKCFAWPHEEYAAGKMIDGDLGTYACLLDDTCTGDDMSVCPPKAAPPVTAAFVLDLGTERTVSGMRFVARNAWVYVMAKNVSVSACTDAQGREQIQPLAENWESPATSNSNSAFVEWSPITTRYLKVFVNDSYQKRYPGQWMNESQLPWCRKLGLPTAGDGKNLNIQIAEITCYDTRPDDYHVKNPPDVAFPRYRLERDWLYQDFGLDIAHVFTSDGDHENELSAVHSVLGEVPDHEPGLNTLRERLDRLVDGEVPACDPSWRSLYLDACAERHVTLAVEQRRASPYPRYTKADNLKGYPRANVSNFTQATSWRVGGCVRLQALPRRWHKSGWLILVEVLAFIALLQVVMIVLDMKGTPAIMITAVILVTILGVWYELRFMD